MSITRTKEPAGSRPVADTDQRENEERLMHVIAEAPFGAHLYRLEQDGTLIFTGSNRAADNILKIDNRLFIGKPIEKAFPALVATEIPAIYRQVAATGRSFKHEQVLYNEQGISGAFEIFAFQTAPYRMAVFFTDITERKKAEDALRESEARYRGLVGILPDGVSLTDLEGKIVFANSRMAVLCGYRDIDNIIGRKEMEFIAPQSREHAREDQRRSLADGPQLNRRYTMVRKDGSVFAGELSVTVLKNGKGKPVGFVKVCRDVTEREEMERMIRDSENRFRLFFSRSPVGLAIVDRDMRFVTVNDVLAGYNGISPQEHVGKTIREVQAEKAELVEPYIRKVLDSGEPVMNHETSLSLGPGNERYFSSSFFPLAGNGGAVVSVGVVVVDLTERKRTEDELEKSRRFVERIVSTTPNFIYIFDLDRKISVFSNFEQMKMLGYSPGRMQELRPGFLGRLLHPDDRERLSLHFEAMRRVKDDEVIEIEYRMRHADGTWRWIRTRDAVFARKPDGTVRQIIGTGTDITEHKNDQERIKEGFDRLQTVTNGIIASISRLVEIRDPYTAGHQKHVGQLAFAMAQELGMSADRAAGIRIAGYIHDIGKLNVPSEILSKPGTLSIAEFEIIKVHPQAGYDILRFIEFPWPVAEVAYQHQERLDGSGYPRQLRENEILPETKVISVADTVEAMTFPRPYRPLIGLKRALAEIEANRGKLFDPDAVDVCLRLFREKRFEFDRPV